MRKRIAVCQLCVQSDPYVGPLPLYGGVGIEQKSTPSYILSTGK